MSARVVKLVCLADASSEVTHPFIRALSWHVSVPAHGKDPKEEQRSLWDGSHVRPNAHARLLLQLDDLTGYTDGAGGWLGDPSIARRVGALRRIRFG